MKLVVSMVVHSWQAPVLLTCLASLKRSVALARQNGLLDSVSVRIHHNGFLVCDDTVRKVRDCLASPDLPGEVHLQQPNRGYGWANNQVLNNTPPSSPDDAVLVINPDVALEEDALSRGLSRLTEDGRCGLVCANLLDWDGRTPQWGCKRYPSLAVLMARQLPFLTRWSAWRRLNQRYEYQDQAGQVMTGVELSSGCFMLMRQALWQDLGGFDDRFFMYFEDYDLSMRANQRGWRHVYDPAIRVRHDGGGAGKKSWRHRWWFLRSAIRFFARHGWRLWRVGLR